MKIEFKIEGNLQRQLQKATQKTKDLSFITKMMGIQMQRSTEKTFRHEGQRGGSIFGFESKKWDDLKDSTKKWRKGIGKSSSPILNLHGSSGLKGSITYEAGRFSTKWGPSEHAPYGKYHQFGTRYMTKRPFIGFFVEDHAFLVKTTREYIQRLFK